jgi:hypothetical protein
MNPARDFQIANLSDKAQHVLTINAAHAYATLVPRAPGAIEAQDILESLKPADVVAGQVRSMSDAACLVSGLWLWHDFLEPSHLISQGIETPAGSLMHAIMHRREGDFSNAKYWLRQAGTHPAFESIRAKADAMINTLPADKLLFKLTANGWNPAAFVDFCEAAHSQPTSDRYLTAVTLQKIEWLTLMEHTARAAV